MYSFSGISYWVLIPGQTNLCSIEVATLVGAQGVVIGYTVGRAIDVVVVLTVGLIADVKFYVFMNPNKHYWDNSAADSIYANIKKINYTSPGAGRVPDTNKKQ